MINIHDGKQFETISGCLCVIKVNSHSEEICINVTTNKSPNFTHCTFPFPLPFTKLPHPRVHRGLVLPHRHAWLAVEAVASLYQIRIN